MASSSMDVQHHQSVSKDGQSAKTATTNKLKESFRDTAEHSAEFQAKKNPNILAHLTSENISMVNDGEGGFRECSSVDEVLAYRQSRHDQVTRKIGDTSFVDTTVVSHYPKDYCDKVPFTDNNGKQKHRYVAKDPEHMKAYFAEVREYFAKNIVDGTSGMHGYSINLDETTPHMHLNMDTFKPGKKEGTLRVAASEMWGQTPEYIRKKTGEKSESGSVKMERYHVELRDQLVSKGYQVELESSERSKEKLDKPSYVEVKEAGEALDVEWQQLGEGVEELNTKAALLKAKREELHEAIEVVETERSLLESRSTDLNDREMKLGGREAEVEERSAEVEDKAGENMSKTLELNRRELMVRTAEKQAERREQEAAEMRAQAVEAQKEAQEARKAHQAAAQAAQEFLRAMGGRVPADKAQGAKSARDRALAAGKAARERDAEWKAKGGDRGMER